MITLGIDPGLAIVGFGVVSSENMSHKALQYGSVITKAHTLLEERLEIIYECIHKIIVTHAPDAMAVEELFFNRNVNTAIDVAQARGVILLAAQQEKVPIYEYTPLQVKQALVGYGRAEKKQMIYMTRTLLGLEEDPKPDDTADALAIAITHANSYRASSYKITGGT